MNKSQSRKADKGKDKKAYMYWEDNNMSSFTDISAKSEEDNLCFMEDGASNSD